MWAKRAAEQVVSVRNIRDPVTQSFVNRVFQRARAGVHFAHFSAEQLEAGHRIYRDGEVRELELTAQDAIVHRRVEKKDEYAVIEWTGEGLSVRSSSTDPADWRSSSLGSRVGEGRPRPRGADARIG